MKMGIIYHTLQLSFICIFALFCIVVFPFRKSGLGSAPSTKCNASSYALSHLVFFFLSLG